MTRRSALLPIPLLGGLGVAAVLLGTARRNVLPRSAMAIAALAIPIWLVYFASSQGRSLIGFAGISQRHAGSALVWLNVWRLHGGFFPCPRLHLWGRKKGVRNACVGLGACRFPHTQFDWIRPLFSVPKASACALQFLRQADSRRRSILLTLRMLAGFQCRTRHCTASHNLEVEKVVITFASHKTGGSV